MKPKKITLGKTSLSEICRRIASADVSPGGGTVSAISGALAAGLVVKVALFTKDKKSYQPIKNQIEELEKEAKKLINNFLDLADQDYLVYEEFSRNRDDEKKIEKAISVPLEIARGAADVFKMASFLAKKGNRNLVSDSRCALELATAAFYGALEMVRVNLTLVKRSHFEAKTRKEIDQLLDRVEDLIKS